MSEIELIRFAKRLVRSMSIQAVQPRPGDPEQPHQTLIMGPVQSTRGSLSTMISKLRPETRNSRLIILPPAGTSSQFRQRRRRMSTPLSKQRRRSFASLEAGEITPLRRSATTPTSFRNKPRLHRWLALPGSEERAPAQLQAPPRRIPRPGVLRVCVRNARASTLRQDTSRPGS